MVLVPFLPELRPGVRGDLGCEHPRRAHGRPLTDPEEPVVRAATSQELAGLLATLGRIVWPADRDSTLRLADELGWTVVRASVAGVRYVTTLTVDDPRARAMLGDDAAGAQALESLTVHVSDRHETDAAGVRAAFETVCSFVSAELGPEVRRDAWEYPRRVWELPTGGRVIVQDLREIVMLELFSLAGADLERDEVRLGVDPHRVPGTGHEGL